ncbi:MAG: helix-hairpin-helix domain-containing protein [Acutalibacter sp.]|nr:helix-hairpin-helix domain-containing protein [Acutalibacter sp.]
MESREKKPEDRQADMIYLLLVFVAFVVAVMVLVSIYSDKPINIYVIPETPVTESPAVFSGRTVSAVASDSAEESPAGSEPVDFFEAVSEVGPQEVLLEKSIDINHADQEELEKLPQIGPVLAKRIIEYRTSYGDFSDVEEILEVSGIGEKTFEKIRDFIYVS